jgi:methyl-accepting chemotaxis protein
MSFARKLYALIALAVAGLLMLALAGQWQIQSVFQAADYANDNSLPSIEHLDEAAEAMFRMRISVWKHIAAGAADKPASDAEIQRYQQRIEAVLARYETEDLSDQHDRELLAHDRRTLADYYRARDAVLKLSTDGQFDAARQLQLSLQPQIKPADEALKQHRAYNVELATAAAARAEAARHSALVLSAVIAGLVTLAVALAGWRLVHQLVAALRDAVRLADAVADGDLSQRAPAGRTDEIGQLQSALNQMSVKLTAMIGQVQHGAGAIQTASAEIASGNMDLSARTEQQAGALEETASSMEQLTSSVQHNAEHAAQARQLAGQAAQSAQDGGAVVRQVVDTMTAIRTASSRIVDIISVIDGIAFQTNILALNAAVEAARAGEQGRGFAVVASEVRQLAHRSADAAKEIKGLIDHSASQVQHGGVLVEQAGDAMQRIVASIERVAGVVGEIADASREQSTGIEQVNEAVTQMDDMTQQNAALVEQSAAAAVAMREQADALTRLVGEFQLAAAAPVTPRTAAAPARAQPRRLALVMA